MTGAEIAEKRGFDSLSPEERRRRVRVLVDQGTLTEEEDVELDILLLMAVGLTEQGARADLLLRRRQATHFKKQNRSLR